MGAVVGYGVPLQGSCLEGFDSLGLHQVKDVNSKNLYIWLLIKTVKIHPVLFAALADVVIAPVWSTEEQGSIPWGGTKFEDRFSKQLNKLLLKRKGSGSNPDCRRKLVVV